MVNATDFKQYGWICPVCGRGVSPWTSVCPCHKNAGTQTTIKDYTTYTGKSYNAGSGGGENGDR